MILISKIKRVETPSDCPSLKYFNVSAEDIKKLSATIKEIKIVDYINMVGNPTPPTEYEIALIESIRRLIRKQEPLMEKQNEKQTAETAGSTGT